MMGNDATLVVVGNTTELDGSKNKGKEPIRGSGLSSSGNAQENRVEHNVTIGYKDPSAPLKDLPKEQDKEESNIFQSKHSPHRNKRRFRKWKLRLDEYRMTLGRGLGLEEMVGMTLRGLVGKFSYKAMRTSEIEA